MSSVPDIIAKWPSAAEMARDIGLRRPQHGAMMKMRKSIPSAYWPALVEAAARRGIEGVTLEALAAAHVAPRRVAGAAPAPQPAATA